MKKIPIPVRMVNNQSWGQLSVFGKQHIICAYSFQGKKDISFAGGHRVRVIKAGGNVHWRIPEGISLDISEVNPPRRRTGR